VSRDQDQQEPSVEHDAAENNATSAGTDQGTGDPMGDETKAENANGDANVTTGAGLAGLPDPATVRLIPMGRSIIAGNAAEPDPKSEVFSARNPATGTLLPSRFQAATRAQVTIAANEAWRAFDAGRTISEERRADLLRALADRLDAFEDTLTKFAQQETGLPLDRLASELGRTTSTLRLFADVVADGTWRRAAIDPADPHRKPSPRPGLRSLLMPLGPVAVFGASNFPLAYSTMGTDSASALAAGCPVIVKGHPLHPGTGEVTAQIVSETIKACGFPNGWFSFLHAGGDREQAIGQELLEHPCVRASGFTGSLAGGTALAEIARTRPDPIPFFAEMGSTNPTFVLPGGLGKEPVGIAQHLAKAISQFAGQQCTCPGLIFVTKGTQGSAFIDRLALELRAAEPTPMLASRIRRNYLERVATLIDLPGVRMAVGDPASIRESVERVSEDRPALESPALLRTPAASFLTNSTLQEEVFGPAAVVVECESTGQLIECAGLIQGSLAASVFLASADLEVAQDLVSILSMRAGRIVFNGVTTGVEVGHATVHGGPFPACNRPETTAVGPRALERWCRPVSFQNAPMNLIPPEIRDDNPRGILRTVDGTPTR
jgi:alpha-ketoglutaric semialdehyde dehydrogenase